MEYLVMECGLSYAVVLDQDGRILKVPNLGYTVGQSLKDVVLLPERPVRQQVLHKRIARWSALAACLCLLLLGSWVWQSPIGTVRMQINPDVLLSVNRFDRVVALEGLNEDGTALIDGYRAYGQEMKTVSDELADRAMELGYLSAGGQITLTVDGKRPSAGQESSEDIIITPPRPDEDIDENDSDDDTQGNGSHEDDDQDVDSEDDDGSDDLDTVVSASGDTEDEQDNAPPVSESDDSDDDGTQDSDDNDNPELPDDDADDGDSDDDNENDD